MLFFSASRYVEVLKGKESDASFILPAPRPLAGHIVGVTLLFLFPGQKKKKAFSNALFSATCGRGDGTGL